MKSITAIARISLVIAFALTVASIANWPQEYISVQVSGTNPPDRLIDSWDEVRAPVVRVTAGWPLKHYVRCEYVGGPPVSVFDWRCLLANLAIWMSLLLAACAYESRMRPKPAADGRRPKRQLAVMDLLVMTGIVAIAMAYGRLLENRAQADSRLALQISRAGGFTLLEACLPKPIASFFPTILHNRFLRITEVTLGGLRPDLLERSPNCHTCENWPSMAAITTIACSSDWHLNRC